MAELVDPNLTTICPVNKPHPRVDLIGASARHVAGQRAGPGRCRQRSLSVLVGRAARLGAARRRDELGPTPSAVAVEGPAQHAWHALSPVPAPPRFPDPAVSGSSRSLYAWRPAPAEEEEEDPEGEGSSGKRRGGGGGGGGGDGGGPSRPRVRRWLLAVHLTSGFGTQTVMKHTEQSLWLPAGAGRPCVLWLLCTSTPPLPTSCITQAAAPRTSMQGSAHFISFDADPEKKGGKRSKAAAPAAAAANEPSPSAGSKGKGKGKASVAVEEEEDGEDEEEGEEEPGPSTGRKRGGSANGKAAPKRQRKRQDEGGKG